MDTASEQNHTHLKNFSSHAKLYYQRSLSINEKNDSIEDQELQACQVVLNALEHQLINAHEEDMTIDYKSFLSSDEVKQHSSQLKSCGLYIEIEGSPMNSTSTTTTQVTLSHHVLVEYAKVRDEQRRNAHMKQMEERRLYLEDLVQNKLKQRSSSSSANNNTTENSPMKLHAGGSEYAVSSQSYLKQVRSIAKNFCTKYKDNIGIHSFLAGIITMLEKQINAANHVILWTFNGSTLSEVSDPNLKQSGEEYMNDAVELLMSLMVYYPNVDRAEEGKEKEYESMYSFHIHASISNPFLTYILSELPPLRKLDARPTGRFEKMDASIEGRRNAGGGADEHMSYIQWTQGFLCEIL